MEEKRYLAPNLTITTFSENDVVLASGQKGEKGEEDFFNFNTLGGND